MWHVQFLSIYDIIEWYKTHLTIPPECYEKVDLTLEPIVNSPSSPLYRRYNDTHIRGATTLSVMVSILHKAIVLHAQNQVMYCTNTREVVMFIQQLATISDYVQDYSHLYGEDHFNVLFTNGGTLRVFATSLVDVSQFTDPGGSV